MKRCFAILVLALFVLSVTASASGDLTATQARKLIAHLAGVELKTNSVRIVRISNINSSTSEATAEIQTAFRLEQDEQKHWRAVEIRTGQDRWEQLGFMTLDTEPRPVGVATGSKKDGTANVAKSDLQGPCDDPNLAPRVAASDLSFKRARCLIAHLLGVQLPSDAVRIKNVSPSLLPLGSHPSALVETTLAADFRFTRAQRDAWKISGVRTGGHDWVDLDAIVTAANAAKAVSAHADLESIAKALERFRAQRGFFVESQNEGDLIDSLNPLYLPRVIRLDPWNRPYRYEGTHDHFRLFSLGADGKENTADDITLTGSASSATR